jgi:hypothetical protein
VVGVGAAEGWGGLDGVSTSAGKGGVWSVLLLLLLLLLLQTPAILMHRCCLAALPCPALPCPAVPLPPHLLMGEVKCV